MNKGIARAACGLAAVFAGPTRLASASTINAVTIARAAVLALERAVNSAETRLANATPILALTMTRAVLWAAGLVATLSCPTGLASTLTIGLAETLDRACAVTWAWGRDLAVRSSETWVALALTCIIAEAVNALVWANLA